MISPDPSTNRLMAGIFRSGSTMKIPNARAKMVPSFMKVLRYPRGASSSHTGSTLAARP